MGKDEETEIAVECSVLDIRFSFDVGRSMLDVGRSFFNITCERLQNNLALMDPLPQHVNAPTQNGEEQSTPGLYPELVLAVPPSTGY